MEGPSADQSPQRHRAEEPARRSSSRVDGGAIAWSQVIAGHLITFNSWGYISSYGLFQAYYAKLLSQPPSAISWVGSTQIFLTFLISTFSTHTLNAGYYRTVLAIGLVLQISAVFATSACRQYWQFFLAQGICQGLGMGLTFAPTVGLVSSYFVRYKAIAVAGIACGMSTGGIFFPLIVQQMLPVGFHWTLRVIGFVFIVNSCIGFCTLRSRKSQGPSVALLDKSALQDWSYLLFAVGMVQATLGMYFAYYYVPAFAEDIFHVNQSKSLNLLLALNAMGVPGRIIPAYIADHLLGPTNTLIVVVLVSGILTFCWAGVTSPTGLWIFVIFYGFFGASVQSLFPPAIASLTADPTKISIRVGMMFSIISVGCLSGTPIAGALIRSNNGNYLYAQMVMGSVMLLSALTLSASRLSYSGLKILSRC